MMLDKLRNRIAGATQDATLQGRVDAVSNAYRRVRESDYASDLRAKAQSGQSRDVAAIGGLLTSVIPGLGNLKGLTTFAAHLQSSGGLLQAVNQIARDLPSEHRATAIRQAISGLSSTSRQDLGARLGVIGSDPASTVSGMLDQADGFEQLLRRLAPGHPAMATLNLIEVLKDPVIKEFARSLIPALVKAKSEIVPPPDTSS